MLLPCCVSPQNAWPFRLAWLLLRHGARVSQKNKLGLTPVHVAAGNGNFQALQVYRTHLLLFHVLSKPFHILLGTIVDQSLKPTHMGFVTVSNEFELLVGSCCIDALRNKKSKIRLKDGPLLVKQVLLILNLKLSDSVFCFSFLFL